MVSVLHYTTCHYHSNIGVATYGPHTLTTPFIGPLSWFHFHAPLFPYMLKPTISFANKFCCHFHVLLLKIHTHNGGDTIIIFVIQTKVCLHLPNFHWFLLEVKPQPNHWLKFGRTANHGVQPQWFTLYKSEWRNHK